MTALQFKSIRTVLIRHVKQLEPNRFNPQIKSKYDLLTFFINKSKTKYKKPKLGREVFLVTVSRLIILERQHKRKPKNIWHNLNSSLS